MYWQDEKLSWKEKGILAFILENQDAKETSSRELIDSARDGRDSVLAGLKNLENHGYILRYRTADNSKYILVGFAEPISLDKVMAMAAGGIKNDRAGYIYLIKIDNMYKIGRAEDLEIRYGQIKQQNKGADVKYVLGIKTNAMCFIEASLHSIYREKNLQNELFLLTDEDIQEIKEMA